MVECPACGSRADKSRLFTVTSDEAAQHFVLAEGDGPAHDRLAALIARAWHGPTCSILRCPDCDLGFAWPFVAGDGEFYNLAFPHGDYPRDKWDYAETVTALEKLDPRQGQVLEVASGFGHFLKQISPRFFPRDSITATEYSDEARAKLTAAGYAVQSSDIRAPDFAQRFAGGFDYIFMFQVLEHMDGLDRLMACLSQVSRPGCHLFLSVPNTDWVSFNERNGSLMDMPPNHISRWSPAALAALGRKLGFETVAWKREPQAWMRFVMQDMVNAYMRRSQMRGTLANRARSLKRSRGRRLLEIATVLLYAPLRLPVWIKAAAMGDRLGGSLWVHFRRP